MDPDLCCKILVSMPAGLPIRGTGYAFAKDRIVTAWHVIENAFESPEVGSQTSKMTLAFGSASTPSPHGTPVKLLWVDATTEIDIAVIECELPKSIKAVHFAYALPHKTPIGWHGQGFTQYAKDNSDAYEGGLDGYDGYDGSLMVYKLHNKSIVLPVSDSMAQKIETKKYEDWAGGSGTVVFTKPENLPLAVVTNFFDGKARDHLLAVPFWYLMNEHPKSADFKKAMRGDLEAEADRHRKWVIKQISGLLERLEDKKTLMEKIKEGISDILTRSGKDHMLEQDATPSNLAHLMVTECEFEEVLVCLSSGLKKKWLPFWVKDDKSRIAKIADYLLPLNYQPELREKLKAEAKVRLVENIVCKKALADVIMAGIEAKEASFFMPVDSPDAIVGSFSFDIFDLPEEGLTDDDTAFDRGAMLIIQQLLPIVQFVPDRRMEIPPHTVAESWAEIKKLSSALLKSRLKSLADDLAERLEEAAKVNERSLYCVLKSPKPHQRQLVWAVINRVSEYVPNLWFVELLPELKDPEQAGILFHIYCRIFYGEDSRA